MIQSRLKKEGNKMEEVLKNDRIFEYILLGILVAYTALDKARSYLKNKNDKTESGKMTEFMENKILSLVQPGRGDECLRHSESITIIETELPHIKKTAEETKENVEKLDTKLDTKFGSTMKILREIKTNGEKNNQ